MIVEIARGVGRYAVFAGYAGRLTAQKPAAAAPAAAIENDR